MKKLIYSTALFCVSLNNYAQNVGDIAFVGFNTDGDKDFSIMTLVDIPANTKIYFTDSEPNSLGNGLISNTEGVIDWDTGNDIINAGTVVTFTDVETTLTASVGTAVDSTIDTGFNITATGDNIFATKGNPATNSVTTWIAGIENRNTGQGTYFSTTGLIVGNTYVVIDDSASKDGGQYNGQRSGLTMSDLRISIANENNWITNTSDGEAVLPFNTSNFQIQTLSLHTLQYLGVALELNQNTFVVNKGEVLGVYTLSGQKVENHHLESGLYLVKVQYLTQQGVYKVLVRE